MSLYEFEGRRPLVSEQAFVHPDAVLIGNVTVEEKCFIGAGAVLRGDFGPISIGRGSDVQENAVAHASPLQPVIVEEDVVIGHGVLMHDCRICRGAVVGMGAVILHGAVIEKEAMVGAGAVVSPRFVVPARKIVVGNPAQVHKDVSDDMLEISKIGLSMYQELPERYKKGFKK